MCSLDSLHFQRDWAMARLLSALFFYSTCFISFYSWWYIHLESRSQLHPASIHRLLHRSKGSICVTKQLATAGSCQSILENVSSVQWLAQAAQKWLGKHLLKRRTHCKSALPSCVGFDHIQSGLEYISGDGQTFLGTVWWSLHFSRASSHAERKRDAIGEWLAIPFYKLKAHLVTPTQLQDGLPLTGTSSSVVLSSMLLTEFSLLHTNNPWILSIAVYFGLALLCRMTREMCKGHPAPCRR